MKLIRIIATFFLFSVIASGANLELLETIEHSQISLDEDITGKKNFPGSDVFFVIANPEGKELMIYCSDKSILFNKKGYFVSALVFSKESACAMIRAGRPNGSKSVGILEIKTIEGKLFSKLYPNEAIGTKEEITSFRIIDLRSFAPPVVTVFVGAKVGRRKGAFWKAEVDLRRVKVEK